MLWKYEILLFTNNKCFNQSVKKVLDYFYFCFFTGLKFCANQRTSHVLHLMWGALYAVCGVVQFVAGIYFMLELPIFQLGSNIWTGAWVSIFWMQKHELLMSFILGTHSTGLQSQEPSELRQSLILVRTKPWPGSPRFWSKIINFRKWLR